MAKKDNTAMIVTVLAAGAAAAYFITRSKCPEGQYWDEVSKTCKTCPDGFHWDPVLEQCVEDIPPGDAQGEILDIILT